MRDARDPRMAGRAPRTIYVRAAGMACPVGLTWRTACAAIRAGIDCRQELPYRDDAGDPITGSRLSLLDGSSGARGRWLSLLGYALADAVGAPGGGVQREALSAAHLFLAVPADPEGKAPSADRLAVELGSRLGVALSPARLRVLSGGAPAGFQAISLAREALTSGEAQRCIVAAADTLVHARALQSLSERRRLLTRENSDGVLPGEAAACLVLTAEKRSALGKISGLGFARELALLGNDLPLRGDGLTQAAKTALDEARLGMHDLDFRLSDAAGESYAFKEQALMMGRMLRRPKERFPVWEVANGLGDTGAAAGLCGVGTALAGFARGYAPGPRAIAFAGNEQGERACLIVEAVEAKDVKGG